MTGRAHEAIYGVQSRMADTWRDHGMTPDDQWQKIHRVQIVEWDRERRHGHKGDANFNRENSARANWYKRDADVVIGALIAGRTASPDTT